MATISKIAPKSELWIAQPIVTFIVDKEEVRQTFVIHKSLATSISPFFKAAFEGNFIEGETQTMRLDDIEAFVFGLLVHWLYTQSLEDGFQTVGDYTSEACLLAYAKLWELAGRCLIPTLQNNIATSLIRSLTGTSMLNRMTFVQYSYNSSDDDTALKRLAVDTMAFLFDATDLRSCVRDLPRNLVNDLTIVLKGNNLASGKKLRGLEYYGVKPKEQKPAGVVNGSGATPLNGIQAGKETVVKPLSLDKKKESPWTALERT